MRRLVLTVLVGALVAAVPASAQPFRGDRDHDRDHDRDRDRGPSRESRETITAWCERYYGTPPDPGSLVVWGNRLDRAADPNQTLSAMLGDPNYYSRTGSTPRRWLEWTFHHMTGRDPSRQEFGFWLDRLFRLGGESPDAQDRTDLAYEMLKRYPQGAAVPGRDRDEDYDYRRPDYHR